MKNTRKKYKLNKERHKVDKKDTNLYKKNRQGSTKETGKFIQAKPEKEQAERGKMEIISREWTENRPRMTRN